MRKFSCKSHVYHNCRIYASDGCLLYYCDKRKLELVIKNYYEGRDINREDLEAALLVGMGPREKRHLSKKKGLVFKQLGINSSFMDSNGSGGNNVETFQW